MKFFKILENENGVLYKGEALASYLYLSEVFGTIIEINNSLELLDSFLLFGGAVLYNESKLSNSEPSEIITELENRFRKGLSEICWAPSLDEEKFKIQFRHFGDKLICSVYEELLNSKFNLISGRDGLAQGYESNFKIKINNAVLYTGSKEYYSELVINLEDVPVTINAKLPETSFSGGLQYFKELGAKKLKRFHSGLFNDFRDNTTEKVQDLAVSIELNPVLTRPQGAKIYLNLTENDFLESLLITSEMKKLKVRPKARLAGSDGFYYERVNTVILDVLAEGFVPIGDLEIVEQAECELLLNSGASKIQISNGDILRFGLTKDKISGVHGSRRCLASSLSIQPIDQAERAFFQVGQNKAFYDKHERPFLPKVSNAAGVAIGVLPYLSEENFQFEKEILEDYRFDQLTKKKNTPPLFKEADDVVTSKGIRSRYLGSQALQYTFTKDKKSSSEFTIDFDENSKWLKLVSALEKDGVFLAFAPAMLGNANGKGYFNFSEWEFDFLNKGFQPLLLMNYGNTSFENAFSNDGIKYWTNHHIKHLFDSTDEQNFLQEQWRQRGAKVISQVHNDHKLIFESPSWKGIMVMDIPLNRDSVPPILKPFMPNVGFNASYIAFGTSVNENDENPTKCYASIKYQSPSQNLDKSKNFDFKLLDLSALFTGSKIVQMKCSIKLGIKTLLDEVGDFNEFIIDGEYSSESNSYIFEIKGDPIEFTFNSLVHKIVFSGATLTYDGDKKRTKLDFKGELEFDFDFNQFDFGKYLPKKINFESLGFDFGFKDSVNSNLASMFPDFSRTKFKVPLPSLSGETFLSSFPLRFNSFHYKTAKDLGFYEIEGDGYIDDAIGFIFDLDLGTLGATASLKNFRAQVFIGWYKDGNKQGPSIGFKFQGFSSNLSFNLFDVIGMDVKKLEICQYSDDTGASRYFIKLENCRLTVLGKEFGELNGAIFTDFKRSKDIGWLLSIENNQNSFLKYLSLGQKIGMSDAELAKGDIKTVDEVADRIKNNIIKLNCNDNNVSDGLFNKNLNWLIGAHLAFTEYFDIKFVFLDPRLYAMRLSIAEILTLDAVYNKINDNTGVWHTKLELPDHLRNWNFGVVDVTFPNIEFDCFTNGGFKFDLGFPSVGAYQSDYSDSAVAQLAIFIGKGGFYFSNTKGVNSFCGKDLRALEFGMALRVGLGREIRKGPLQAGASITVYGLLVGAGCFKKKELIPDNYQIRGRVGVILEVFGRVDFGIISAGVHLWVEIYSILTLEKPVKEAVIKAGGNVVVTASIRVKIGPIKVAKSFDYRTRIEYTFKIGGGKLLKNNPLDNKLISKAKKRSKVSLKIVYLPDLSIRENTKGDAQTRIYHSIALLTEYKTINDECVYSEVISVGGVNLPGNPLKKIVEQFKLIEKSFTKKLIPESYSFIDDFSWDLVALNALENEDVSRIQLPFIPRMKVNNKDLNVDVSEELLKAIELQYLNCHVRGIVREDYIKIPRNLSSEQFIEFWLDNFFSFVYQKASEINDSLDLTDNEYCILEGSIYYFLESGLRLPKPSSLSRSIPYREVFHHGLNHINGSSSFSLKVGGQSSEVFVDKADLKVLEQEYANDSLYLRELLERVLPLEEYELKDAEFAVNKNTLRIINSLTYFSFPESMINETVSTVLRVGNEKEEVSFRGDQEINFISATNVKLYGNVITGLERGIVLFEIKGSDSENSKILRQLSGSNIVFNNLSLIAHGAEGSQVPQDDFIIYRNNLSRVTGPPISKYTGFMKVKKELVGAARFSENPELFIQILRDATLINNGGYFIELEASTSKLLSSQPGEQKTFELLFSLPEINVKRNFQNIFSLLERSHVLEKQVPYFSEVEMNGTRVQEYVSRMPSDAIGFELSYTPLQKPLIDTYSLREDYSLLEYSLKCGDFELTSDQTVSIPPNNEKDENKQIYRHSSPILPNFDEDGKPVNRNPYEHVGSTVKLAFNWRNGQGERLFNKPVYRKEAITKLYSDKLIPVKEWPDLNISIFEKNQSLKIKFTFDFQDLLISILIKRNLIKFKTDYPATPQNLTFKETVELTDDQLSSINEELKAHYFGSEKSDYIDENGGVYFGVLKYLQAIKDQTDDLMNRKDQKASINLLFNGVAIEASSFDGKLCSLLTEYVSFIENRDSLYNEKKLTVVTHYRKSPENNVYFNKHEVQTGLTPISELITEVNENDFNELIKGVCFAPLEISVKLKRPDSLTPNKSQSKNNLDPLRSVGESLSFLSIPDEVLLKLNNCLDKVSFGKGFDTKRGKIVPWIINNKKVLKNSSKLAQETGINKNRVEHLLKPVLNHKWTGVYKRKVGKVFVTNSFSEIDIDIALEKVLNAYEAYLKPNNYSLLKSFELGDLNIMLKKKSELSTFLAKTYLYQRELGATESKVTKNDKIIAELENNLKESLNNYYLLDGAAFFNTKKTAENFEDFKLLVSHTANESNVTNFISKPGKIQNDELVVIVDMQGKNGEADSRTGDKLNLAITHIEHSIQQDLNEIDESNWIQLLEPFNLNVDFSGISLPSRNSPQNPETHLHGFEYDRQKVDGSWSYRLEFSYKPNNSDKLLLSMRFNETFSKSSENIDSKALDIGAVAYLSEIIDFNRESNPKEVISKIIETDLLKIVENKSLDLNTKEELIEFIYSERDDTWYSNDYDKWKIERFNDIWVISSTKANMLNIFGDQQTVCSSVKIIQNEEFGDNFRIETDDVPFTGKLIPFLDYINIEDTLENEVRQLDGKSLLAAIIKTNLRGVTVIEGLGYYKNGVKHLLSGEALWRASWNGKNYDKVIPDFKEGNYYKIIHVIGSGGDYEESFQADFIHRDRES